MFMAESIAAMHNTASMVAWSEKPFVAVSFNYRWVMECMIG